MGGYHLVPYDLPVGSLETLSAFSTAYLVQAIPIEWSETGP